MTIAYRIASKLVLALGRMKNAEKRTDKIRFEIGKKLNHRLFSKPNTLPIERNVVTEQNNFRHFFQLFGCLFLFFFFGSFELFRQKTLAIAMQFWTVFVHTKFFGNIGFIDLVVHHKTPLAEQRNVQQNQ